MAKDRQRAGESNWMLKVAPKRVAILAKMTKYRQRAGDIQNVVIVQIRCQCVHFWTYLSKQQMWRNRKKIMRITLQGMGTGVHWDVWVNVGHDDPPQLGDKVTLLVLVLVPLFVLHLPGGAEHDPQADQLLTWMKIYIYKSNTVEPLLWDTSFQRRRHYSWVPQRALQSSTSLMRCLDSECYLCRIGGNSAQVYI